MQGIFLIEVLFSFVEITQIYTLEQGQSETSTLYAYKYLYKHD